MPWLIESFLNENEDTKKAIEDHKQEIKDIDAQAKAHIAKINKDANERIEDDPDKKKIINTVRRAKITAVNKKAEVIKNKHREAINNLEKNEE